MAIRIEIPAPMREHAGGNTVVEVTAATVQAAIGELTTQYPAMQAKLFDGTRLRPHINVFVNDEDIRYLDDLATVLKDGDALVLLPAVAGGAS